MTTTLDGGVKKRIEIILKKLDIGWTDIILSVSMELLKEHDPKAYLDFKYREEEEKLALDRTSVREREENLQKIQHEIIKLGEIPESDNDISYKGVDEFGDEKENFYQKNKKQLIEKFDTGNVGMLNFKIMIMRCNFKNKKEAIQWTAKRIKQDKANTE